jgi:hypothetical protein
MTTIAAKWRGDGARCYLHAKDNPEFHLLRFVVSFPSPVGDTSGKPLTTMNTRIKIIRVFTAYRRLTYSS